MNYSSFLKSKNGQTIGSYDLHRYEIEGYKDKVRRSLDEEEVCLWADFDNLGRLVVARGSKIFIYDNLHHLIKGNVCKTFNFEQILASE